jgi:sugar lactone lactonase YvrE
MKSGVHLLLTMVLLVQELLAQPTITTQPVNQTAVWGGNATFSVMATDVGPLTYQWQLNGTNLPNNIISTVAGGNLFNNLPATNTILNSAAGVARDGFGNLFIADTYNNVIRKVDTNGLTTIVAGNASGGYSGDGGTATSAQFNLPVAVIVDATGNLLVADSGNNRIRKVATNGIISTVAGNGISGFSGDNGFATAAEISNPSGLCLDAAGNLFIADTYNFVIRKVAITGIITTVAGAPNNPGTFYSPTGVAVDSSNNLYVADSHNNRVSKVNTSGTISTFAGNGTTNYSGDGGPAKNASLNLPIGVAVDAAHNLFIVDSGNNCIRKVGTNNVITTVAGNGTMGFSGDGGSATNANLASPQNVAVDGFGNLLIADAGNNRIRQVGTNGIIATVAGRVPNDGDFATNATLGSASGVAFDAAWNLYIADSHNNRIRKVDTNGIITTVAGNGFPGYSGDGASALGASLNVPSGLTLDASGNLYIADTLNHCIRKVDTNGIISTVAGNGVFGNSGNGGAATNAQLSFPCGVAADVFGNLFIADRYYTQIRKVDTNGIITVANSSPDGNPFGVAVDSVGNLFIAYTDGQFVRKVSTNGINTTVAGINFVVGGFSGDGGSATSAKLSFPEGLAVDTTGNLFISDTFNFRIRKVNTNGIINTIAGNGTNGYSGDGGPANHASLNNPFGMALDSGGSVYFADTGNNRVRKLSYVDFADQPSFTLTNITLSNLGNNFSVIITSASGSVTSSVASLNLQLPPITSAFTATNGIYTFSWSAVSNLTYQLQYATNLVAPNWINLGNPVTATNGSASTTDAIGSASQRFYRVRLLP